MRNPLMRWPLLRQVRQGDLFGRGVAAKSGTSERLRPRTVTADKVVKSICPYCGVGCAQNIYVKDNKIVHIEGDPDSPVNRGRLCPKGAATLELSTGPSRRYHVLYRRPHGTDWERLPLEQALDMVADRVIETRARSWEWESEGRRTRRTMGIASLGGATLDNEENYLIKKLFTSLGIVQIENQARLCHSATVAGLGTSFGRGGATTCMQDMQHSDCIVIEGSSFAEAHPVGFQWVMEAKARGATVIHVDPRFTRTSALADIHVPIRAGSDIAFLGGIIRYVLENDKWFRDYVLNYTNASTIVTDDYEDTEDLGGLFAGLHEEETAYENDIWQYEGFQSHPEQQQSEREYKERLEAVKSAGHAESHGSGGAGMHGSPHRDPSLENPRCVLNLLRRHFARYTPEEVERTCGIPQSLFRRVCETITERSGPDRTTAFAYAVGWTQHTVGSQFIRAASVLQLLLGNIGRPGGGIQALRGHASIQGSTDVPTLFNLLPGYLPMPHAYDHQSLDEYASGEEPEKGYWGDMRAYMVSLLKAWFAGAAHAGNDYCWDYLPRLTGSHSTYETVMAQLEGTCKGYFLMGENPAVGSANAKMQRMAMANLDWLVVRDFSLIESATWWKDGSEIDTGELRTEDIGTEVFFFPAASHTEKNGAFTNTNRLLQWHYAAKEPDGEARSDLWFMYHLGRKIRQKLAGSTEERDRPLLDLTWDYPTEGTLEEPKAEAILAEINGYDAEGSPLASYEQLNDDGSTACGCWIYCGSYADGVNQTARRVPAKDQNWLGPEWCWAWPANRRILYNRASADPDGKPWSDDKALVWWDEDKALWTGHDIADFKATKSPYYRPPKGATVAEALAGNDPFIMQADGKGWLYVPAGLVDGPMPTHYEPQESPVANPMYHQQRNPVREVFTHEYNRYHPSGREPGAEVFPYVVTTYRLTEHFTAGGMSRWSSYLSELQPEMFCELSPELAEERGLEHGGWATIVTARNAIEARVMVTSRIATLTVDGRTVHQIGLPFHWGTNGYTQGDSANDLTSIALDPNIHIQEVKALTADIRPGRRPRGPARAELVREYQRRAGITPATGTEVIS
ncbi:formate dehydrogenase [Streptomyces sp. SLBN-31]|uniref:formate dehydrogenase n=1 Tax=Streptomyces sp. SLBN-31 TaxID=2768444 RepID=UPI0011535713|nr:formate dehydrogenase [Streptomyces sp. SLBN-31]TQJ91268.1 formate dehydrogenase major subunit [Streptomyces sp. SLBN-31]